MVPKSNNELLSEEERQHLLSELCRLLVWVGEPLPNNINVNGEIVKIHELIWWCIHEKEFTDQEKEHFKYIIHSLEIKEKEYEHILKTDKITCKEAANLYHEIASIDRAIMDIKECADGKVQLKEFREESKYRTEDAKRWINFLKSIGRKSC